MFHIHLDYLTEDTDIIAPATMLDRVKPFGGDEGPIDEIIQPEAKTAAYNLTLEDYGARDDGGRLELCNGIDGEFAYSDDPEEDLGHANYAGIKDAFEWMKGDLTERGLL